MNWQQATLPGIEPPPDCVDDMDASTFPPPLGSPGAQRQYQPHFVRLTQGDTAMHFAATAIAAATLLPIVAIDLAKSVFQLYFIGADGKPVNRRITRAKLLPFFTNREHSLVVMETCAGAHHWARELLV